MVDKIYAVWLGANQNPYAYYTEHKVVYEDDNYYLALDYYKNKDCNKYPFTRCYAKKSVLFDASTAKEKVMKSFERGFLWHTSCFDLNPVFLNEKVAKEFVDIVNDNYEEWSNENEAENDEEMAEYYAEKAREKRKKNEEIRQKKFEEAVEQRNDET